MLDFLGGGGGKLTKVKPGLLFLLKLAWESRTRLPLLIMSGFLAMGIRIQMEINIDRASRYIPRVRLEDDGDLVPPSDDDTELVDDDDEDGDDDEDDDSSQWLTEYDSDELEYYGQLEDNNDWWL